MEGKTAELITAQDELTSIPYGPHRTPIEAASIFIENRLGPGRIGERLGFKGFRGKVVADVGIRDGRYTSVFKNLGAKEVFGIEPDEEDLNKAIASGVIDKKHAILATIQDASRKLREKIDVCVVFNISPLVVDDDKFMEALHRVLKKRGQLIITFAEYSSYEKFVYKKRSYRGSWGSVENTKLISNSSYRITEPHKYLVVATKTN